VTTKILPKAAIVLLLMWFCADLRSQTPETTNPIVPDTFMPLRMTESAQAARPLSLSAQASQAANDSSAAPLVLYTPPSRRFDMAMLSVPVPGLGLAVDGHPWWGLAALAGTVGCSYWTYYQYGAEDAAYKQYLSSKTPGDAQNAWNNDRLQNGFFVTAQILTGVIYATQIIAAAVAAPRRLGRRRPPKFVQPGPEDSHLVVGPLCASYQVRW
jgi:hypothetical protein